MPPTTQRPKTRGATQRRATTARPKTRSTATRTSRTPSLRRKPQPKSKGQQILGALTSAVPAGKAASTVKSGASKTPTKGLAILGAAGGLAAVLKSRGKLPFGGGSQPEPVAPPAPPVTSVPEPSPTSVRPDGTL